MSKALKKKKVTQPKTTRKPRIKIDEYYKAGKIDEFQKAALEMLVNDYEASKVLHNASGPSYELPTFVNRNLKETSTLIKIGQANFYQEMKKKFGKMEFSIRTPKPGHIKKHKSYKRVCRVSAVKGVIVLDVLLMVFGDNMGRDEIKDRMGFSSEKVAVIINKGLNHLIR